MGKDWIGNSKTTFVQLGASSHSNIDREENDFYSTDPETLKIFLNALDRDNIKLHNDIWECACGKGHLSKVLIEKGYSVLSSDKVNRGYGKKVDFLEVVPLDYEYDILTNPPYKYAYEFVNHSLDVIKDDYYVIMLLKIQFLEGQKRKELFEKNPPKFVYVNSKRQTCYINGDMSKKMSSASCYCWYIWQKGFHGETIVRWI